VLIRGVRGRITPSLAYMAEATTSGGVESYGVVDGIYNVAWAAGGASAKRDVDRRILIERIGFDAVTMEVDEARWLTWWGGEEE